VWKEPECFAGARRQNVWYFLAQQQEHLNKDSGAFALKLCRLAGAKAPLFLLLFVTVG